MRLEDITQGFMDFWNEYKIVKSGIAGLILLLVFIVIIILEPFIIPFSQTNSNWRDIRYWEDNARSAPPVWIDIFKSQKHARSKKITQFNETEDKKVNMRIKKVIFTYDYSKDIPPLDIIFHCRYNGSPVVILHIQRPDNKRLELLRKSLKNGNNTAARISIDKDARQKANSFALRFDRPLNTVNRRMINPTKVIFSRAEKGILTEPGPLKGQYKITAELLFLNDNDATQDLYLFLPGSVSGLLGTDNSKRDLWSGIIAGVKWALLIGLLTSFISVSIGVIYGVVCAYLGGWQDSFLQRIFEIFLSIPLLPLLIVMSAVFQPSIYILIFMMSLFFWVGPVKTVRSIGLQIKEEVYIEASKAFGASGFRIVFKHMVPLLIPYSFASMALYVPQAIVYESSISLLGLGDSTIVTWGQILHDALTGGAVINGQWWWIIPPGLAIALMGMTFAFIGFAMDKILHPKLRTR